MQWHCKRFDQLSLNELYELLKLRCDVFVVEQNCPYPELDDKDRHPETHHLFATKDGTIVAYARLLACGVSYANHTSIGRVVIHQANRQEKLGHVLIDKAIEENTMLWPDSPIKIGAQAHLEGFYTSHGFTKASEIYLEDGIEHIDMIRG